MKNKLLIMILILSAAAFAPPAAGDKLARLSKEEAARIPPALLAQIQGLQELRASWVVRIEDDLAAVLDLRGIALEILDNDPEGKAYFLVRVDAPSGEAELKARGETRVLDDRTCLFWTDGLEARDVLPERHTIKRLSLENRLRIKPPPPPAPPAPLRPPEDRRLPRKAEADSVISGLVSQVSKANLTQSIHNLQDFNTRYASTSACESAGTSLFQYFSDQGLAVEYQSFTFGSKPYTSRNIVATLPGQASPEDVVIVCAHYDSYSGQAATLAPGADDNASGTAAVMEIARILAGDSFDFTVKFICFSAEEWGLYGSEHYAKDAAEDGEQIVGVINLDMISYAPSLPEDLDLFVNDSSRWLADRFSQAADLYAPMSIRTIVDPSARWSDHSPFWDQGYSALCGIEDSDNPYYHTINDTLGTLNLEFTTSITRAALAAAADLAQPTDVVPTPTGLRARSQISGSLFASSKTVFLDWNPVAEPVSGYNVYRTTTPHSNHLKINSALLTDPEYKDEGRDPDTVYYYVVTAVDADGRESNFSQEVSDDDSN